MASGLDGPRGGSGRVDSERRLRLGENLDRGRNQPPALTLVRRASRFPTSDRFSLVRVLDGVLAIPRSGATARGSKIEPSFCLRFLFALFCAFMHFKCIDLTI